MNARPSALAPLLLLAACAQPPAGTYEAVLPAASGSERHVRVTLNPNGEAALSSAYSDRASRYLAQGTWKQDGKRITVDFNDQEQMVFQQAGTQLIAKEWNRSAWGEIGPGALFRVDR